MNKRDTFQLSDECIILFIALVLSASLKHSTLFDRIPLKATQFIKST